MVKVVGLSPGTSKVTGIYTNGHHLEESVEIEVTEPSIKMIVNNPETTIIIPLRNSQPNAITGVITKPYSTNIKHFTVTYRGTGLGSAIFISGSGRPPEGFDSFSIMCTAVEDGEGFFDIFDDQTQQTIYSVPAILGAGNTQPSTLTEVFNTDYGFGVSSFIKEQSLGLIPFINEAAKVDLDHIDYKASVEGVVLDKVGKLGVNLTIPENLEIKELTITAEPKDKDNKTLGDSLEVTLPVETSTHGVIAIIPAENQVAVGSTIGLSASTSGFDLEDEYVKYESESAIENYLDGSWLNGSILVNGSHSVLIDYSPMLKGETKGYARIKAQVSTPQGALQGVPCSCLVEVI